MATRSQWIAGARPRTLPAAIAPVLIGCAIAEYQHAFRPFIALCAFIVALALQVGVNYANDYSDGIRGTDDVRVGPVRLVGQGLATPNAVKQAAFICFGVAGIAGLAMTALSHLLILIPIGISAIIAAWFYTGGKSPYGYLGLGELFVFTYFGLVAVCGTTASQISHLDALSLIAGCACGLLSTAILLANNIRDIPQDVQSGKRTLASRIGDSNARFLYIACVLTGIALSCLIALQGPRLAAFGLAATFVAIEPLRIVIQRATGKALIPVLVGTGRTLMVYSLIVSFGIFCS